jgi:hypothetical protein
MVGYGNDLATLRQDLAAEWHPTRNADLTPDQVVPGSNQYAWWQCEHGHEWRAMIASRNRGHGCERCCGDSVSRIEIRIFAELQYVLAEHIEETGHDVRLSALPGSQLRVDMCFGRIVVEYDGAYWHRNRLMPDQRKTDRLTRAGYRVLRIREQPLPLITDNDVSVTKDQEPHAKAIAVLRRMRRLRWLPAATRPQVNTYIAADTAQADTAATALIAARRSIKRSQSLASVNPKPAAEWYPTGDGDLLPEDRAVPDNRSSDRGRY